MVSEFGFLEYRFDPAYVDADVVDDLFLDLGFVKIATHKNKNVSVWQLNLNIVFVVEAECNHDLQLSGLGFMCNQDMLNEFSAGYDEDTDLYVVQDPNGLKILFYPYTEYNANNSLLSDNYVLTIGSIPSGPLLSYTSAIVYNDFSDSLVEFYEKLGFRITKTGNDYVSMVAENNRFTIMFNIKASSKNISALVCETDDVFHTTAYYMNKEFEFKKYCKTHTDFDELNYKINGYNCLAVGSSKSYTIENRIINALPNMDIIFRMRKKYIHLNETTLQEHYCEEVC